MLILPRAWSLLRDCVRVLLESAPPGVDVELVREHLRGAAGVTDVHDLHAWSITSGMPALSAHVTVTDEALARRGVGPILDELGECVATHFGIDHATFQVEPESHQEHEPGEAHRVTARPHPSRCYLSATPTSLLVTRAQPCLGELA